MDNEVKTLEEWERVIGSIFKDATPEMLATRMTQDELNHFVSDALVSGTNIGVNHADRVLFLQDNGYEVTRENMINPNLSARPDYDPNAIIEQPEEPADSGQADISVI